MYRDNFTFFYIFPGTRVFSSFRLTTERVSLEQLIKTFPGMGAEFITSSPLTENLPQAEQFKS
jgi:hypothetical protein